ncbi:MAG: PcfK-like family protein [Clostridiales bacterium]|nr:PcfK-like family protein [Clostridiales bacterium]
MEVREKLSEEKTAVLASVKPEFLDMMDAQFSEMFNTILEKAESDPEFEAKVLQEHKTFQRCMKYCISKAMGVREPTEREKDLARRQVAPIVTPVSSDITFQWIWEYYDADDKEEFEKEQAQIEKWDKARDKKAAKPATKPAAKTTAKPAAGAPAEPAAKPEPKPVKKKKGELEGQLSLFAM